MTEFLLAALQVVTTFFVARILGSLLMRRLGRDTAHPCLRIARETAVGLIPVSYLVFALVCLGLLQRRIFLGLLAAGGLALVVVAWKRGRPHLSKWNADPLTKTVAALGVILLAWLSMNAVLPPTGIDEFTYHLAVPERLLSSGGAQFTPDNVYAYFPQLVDMLFLFGLAVAGESAAKLFHLGFLLLCAFALYGFSSSRLGPSYALLAPIVFVTVPTALIISTLAYVDLAFCLYAFLALAALLDLVREPRLPVVVMTGLFVGGAWAIKYTGLQLLLLLALVFLIEGLLNRDRRFSWKLLLVPLIAVTMVLPYLVRNWHLTGWPLFPFSLGPLQLAEGINWDLDRSRLFLAWLGRFGAGEGGLADRFLAPVLVFIQGRIGDLDYYDGVAGLVFLLAPLPLIRMWSRQEIRVLWLFTIGLLFYWSLTTRQVRFLLPALIPLSFLVAAAVEQLRSRAVALLAGGLVLLNLSIGLKHQLSLEPFDYWTGREDRAQFLERRIRGAWIYLRTGELVPAGEAVYLVNMGNFVYLLQSDWRSDFVFEYYRLGKALEEADDPAALAAFFRSQRTAYLLMDESVTLSETTLPERESRVLAAFLREHTELLVNSPREPGKTLRKIRF